MKTMEIATITATTWEDHTNVSAEKVLPYNPMEDLVEVGGERNFSCFFVNKWQIFELFLI